MKQSLILASILLCIFILSFIRNNKTSVTYAFHQESIAYTDMQRMYTPDSGAVHLAFFQRPNLQELQVSFTCLITKTILEKNGDSLQIAYNITQPEITLTSNIGPIPTTHLEIELTTPLFTTESVYGQIGTVRTSASISSFTANMQKEVISRLQFVHPSHRSNTWNITEMNSTGSFNAHYTKTSNGYEKTNTGYITGTSVWSNQQVINAGKSIITLNSLQIIQTLKNSETLTTLLGPDTISISGTKLDIHQQFNPLGISADYKKLLSSPDYQESSLLATTMSSGEIRTLAYQHTLGNENFESLTKQLRTNTHDKDSDEKLTMKFRALAFLHPADCQKIATLLSAESYNTSSYQILSNALTRTNTYSATNTLSSLINQKKSNPSVVMPWLTALAMTTVPTDSAISVCKLIGFENYTGHSGDQADPSLISTARLALGAIANHLRPFDSAKSEQLVQYLIIRMSTDQDTLQRLLVLGNSGSPLIMSILQNYINTPSLNVRYRLAAIKALRFINTTQVDSLLHLMQSSSDSTTRATASETLKFRLALTQNP
jgi:Lipoprotein amino terminal region